MSLERKKLAINFSFVLRNFHNAKIINLAAVLLLHMVLALYYWIIIPIIVLWIFYHIFHFFAQLFVLFISLGAFMCSCSYRIICTRVLVSTYIFYELSCAFIWSFMEFYGIYRMCANLASFARILRGLCKKSLSLGFRSVFYELAQC